MKIIWTLFASMKNIIPNNYYSEYDDKNLNSKYWIDDITSFIEDNNGIIINKCIYINKYEIIFSCKEYDFKLNNYIKFSSGRFNTLSIVQDPYTCLYMRKSYKKIENIYY